MGARVFCMSRWTKLAFSVMERVPCCLDHDGDSLGNLFRETMEEILISKANPLWGFQNRRQPKNYAGNLDMPADVS